MQQYLIGTFVLLMLAALAAFSLGFCSFEFFRQRKAILPFADLFSYTVGGITILLFMLSVTIEVAAAFKGSEDPTISLELRDLSLFRIKGQRELLCQQPESFDCVEIGKFFSSRRMIKMSEIYEPKPPHPQLAEPARTYINDYIAASAKIRTITDSIQREILKSWKFYAFVLLCIAFAVGFWRRLVILDQEIRKHRVPAETKTAG